MEKITRKKFVDLLISHASYAVSTGCGPFKETDVVLKIAKDATNSSVPKDAAWRKVIKTQTNAICFGQPGDDIYKKGSWLYFSQDNTKFEYYQHGDYVMQVGQCEYKNCWEEPIKRTYLCMYMLNAA